MRKVYTLIKEAAIFFVALSVFSLLVGYLRAPKPSIEHLKGVTFELVSGERYTPTYGKPLLIHFWASWCKVCKAMEGNVEELSKHYEVVTIAVSSGDDVDILKHINSNGFTFRVVNDRDGEWAKRFNVTVFPSDFVFDAKGKLKFRDSGYTTTAGLWARMKQAE